MYFSSELATLGLASNNLTKSDFVENMHCGETNFFVKLAKFM